MALVAWVNVPEFRRDNESAVIQRTAWVFAAQHEDGNIIKRETGVIVRGNLLTTGETYAYDYLPLGCGRKDRAWHPVEALYDLPHASKAWFLCFSSFLHDFGFIGSKPGGVNHLHRETCIIDILTTFHMTESKPRRLLCTLNTNFHNIAVTHRAQVRRQRGHVYCRSGVRGALRGLHMSGGYSRSSAPSSATPLLRRCKYAGTTAHASFTCNMV
eukprot:jgi/Tetstr1/428627/TSEL_018616.t1